jgi:hypothetical protein
MFSGNAKLCFIRDEKSGKDFWVNSGATLSLILFQSAAAATGPQLQAVNKPAIRTWNFVNTVVKFNGWEYTFAFLRADVPFPIIGLDFLGFFWDAGQPLLPRVTFCTYTTLPGRRHRRGFKCPPFLFFGLERDPGASAESRRWCLPYPP